MDDTKVEIKVELTGKDAVKRGLAEISQAQEENTRAEREHTAATQADAQVTAQATAATQANTRTQQANTQAAKANTQAQKDAANTKKQLKKAVAEARAESERLAAAQKVLASLMRGDFVGACKAAGTAIAAVGTALSAGLLGALAAAVAVVKSLAVAWNEAREQAEEYSAALERQADWNRKANQIRGNERTPEKLSDEELAAEEKRLTRSAERAAQRADEANQQAERKEEHAATQSRLGRWTWKKVQGVNGWFGIDVKNRTDEAKEARAFADEQLDVEGAIRERLKSVKAERAKRADASASATEAKGQSAAREAERLAADKELAGREQARLEARKRYDETERRAGKIAALQAEKADIETEAGTAKSETERVRLLSKAYDLEKAIAAEREKLAEQAEREAQREQAAEMRRAEAQADWERSRRLENMGAAERLKALESEIKFTRQLERTPETEARMRSLIDERDSAKKEIERGQKAQADWERSRKLAKMSTGERLELFDEERKNLLAGPRNAETEARMRNLVDERDRTLEAQKRETERRNQFLHRNDTDAEKLSRVREQLADAQASGDQMRMLELMMAGEDVAGNYQEPQNLHQQRIAAKKARRDEKRAFSQARQFRRQMAGIEEGWRKGDAGAMEQVARMTATKNGVPSEMQMRDGKLVKVEGTDRTNQLLETIAKSLQ